MNGDSTKLGVIGPTSFTLDNDPDHWASALKCSVCFDYFTEPRCLPCGHTFCKKCIEEIIEHTRVWGARRKLIHFPCPHCRHQVLEKHYVRYSPRNVVLEGILESWQSKEKKKEKLLMATQSTQTDAVTTDVVTKVVTKETATQTELIPPNVEKPAFEQAVVDKCHTGPNSKSAADSKGISGEKQNPSNTVIEKIQAINTLYKAKYPKAPLGLTDSFKKKLTVPETHDTISFPVEKSSSQEEPLANVKCAQGVNEQTVLACIEQHKLHEGIVAVVGCNEQNKLHEGIVANSREVDKKSGLICAKATTDSDRATNSPHNTRQGLRKNSVISTLFGLKPAVRDHFKMTSSHSTNENKSAETSIQSLEDVLHSLSDRMLPGDRIHMGQFELMGLTQKTPAENDLSEVLGELFH